MFVELRPQTVLSGGHGQRSFYSEPRFIYKDAPGRAYHFPKRYLNMVKETVGDWVVFYQGRKGAFGYTSIQKVLDVVPDLDKQDHFFATLEPSTEWSFEQVVPRAGLDGMAFEHSIRGKDGRPISGGVSVSAVRRLSEQEFVAIVMFGMQELSGPDALPRDGYPLELQSGFAEHPQMPFGPARIQEFRKEQLTSRKLRNASFARQVKAAYGGRCAVSGLSLRNGGGRPEVQAAHIRPVQKGGPDTVRNGLALSGTLHWMFDRGLISIRDDFSILVSHNKVPEVAANRLIAPGQKLILPKNESDYPHPDYLRFHREEIYGHSA